MAYQSYNYDQNTGMESGGGFLMGLLSGVVVGVGVGMLLAPRTGAELRQNLAQSAGDLQRAASDSFNQMSGKVKETAERGREALGNMRGKETWNTPREESGVGSASTTGSSYGTGSTGSGYNG